MENNEYFESGIEDKILEIESKFLFYTINSRLYVFSKKDANIYRLTAKNGLILDEEATKYRASLLQVDLEFFFDNAVKCKYLPSFDDLYDLLIKFDDSFEFPKIYERVIDLYNRKRILFLYNKQRDTLFISIDAKIYSVFGYSLINFDGAFGKINLWTYEEFVNYMEKNGVSLYKLAAEFEKYC